MGWVWSDELAAILESNPRLAGRVPRSWSGTPCAFVLEDGELPADAAHRLLGVDRDREPRSLDLANCTCLASG